MASACPKCGSTATIAYSVRCLDKRTYYRDDGADESAEIVVVGRWPKTGICESCSKRVPLPERPVDE